MSYAQRKQLSGNPVVAWTMTLLIVGGLLYAIVTGLAYNVVKKGIENLKVVDVEDKPPPPPKEPPPPPKDMPKVPPPPVTPPPLVRMEAPPPPIQTVTAPPPQFQHRRRRSRRRRRRARCSRLRVRKEIFGLCLMAHKIIPRLRKPREPRAPSEQS